MTSEAITEWAAVTTAAATVIGVFGAGLGWLYHALTGKFEDMQEHVERLYKDHEGDDQRRHEDNIRKFDAQDKVLLYIRLALARAGLNGEDQERREIDH